MPRYRRRRRSYAISRPVKAVKYSAETYAAYIVHDASNIQNQSCIVFTPASDVLGTRKCKNFTLSLTSPLTVPVAFALVFVPQGTQPSQITAGTQPSSGVWPAASLYEPNQNVILSGTFGGPGTTVERFKTRLARNLNSGDYIALVCRALATGPADTTIFAILNYAIAY